MTDTAAQAAWRWQQAVRAVALQRRGGAALPNAVGQLFLAAGLAATGAVFWFVYLAAAVAAAGAVAIALLDVLAAQRYLDTHPVRP